MSASEWPVMDCYGKRTAETLTVASIGCGRKRQYLEDHLEFSQIA